MQIHEITLLKENALGAFGAGFAQGAGINMPSADGLDNSSTVTGYGDARQKAAAQQAQPLIAQLAKQEMQGWNMAIADMLKQEKVQSTAELSPTARITLKRNLWDRLHKVLMQGKLGTNYVQSLPSSVDKRSRPAATKMVNQLNAATQAVMNFKQPAKDAAQQLMQWTTLARNAYDAMSLAQFNPAQRSGQAKRMPEIKPNPDKSFNIGNQKINPLDPVGKEITQKIQAAQAANSNQVPNIISAQDGIRIGNSLLDPRNPTDAKIIELIQSQQAADTGVAA